MKEFISLEIKDFILFIDFRKVDVLPRLTMSWCFNMFMMSGGFLIFGFAFAIKNKKRREKEAELKEVIEKREKASKTAKNE